MFSAPGSGLADGTCQQRVKAGQCLAITNWITMRAARDRRLPQLGRSLMPSRFWCRAAPCWAPNLDFATRSQQETHKRIDPAPTNSGVQVWAPDHAHGQSAEGPFFSPASLSLAVRTSSTPRDNRSDTENSRYAAPAAHRQCPGGGRQRGTGGPACQRRGAPPAVQLAAHFHSN